MKVTISQSKNQKIYYISKSIRLNGKSTTRTVEKLGTEEEVRARAGGMDPYEWAKRYAAALTRREKETGEAIRYSPTRLIRKNADQTINISFLFPQDIYYDLRINEICDGMTSRYKLPFDLNAVFSRLIYTRVVYHASKHGTYSLSKKFLDKPEFEEPQIDQALYFLSVSPLIFQRQLYRKMLTAFKPNASTMFYDCTSYYFEIGNDSPGARGKDAGKQTAAPIVQIGLFTDARGIPLSFDMMRDAEAEPPQLTGLEKEIIEEQKPERIVVCYEAGLAQIAERKFRDIPNVKFVRVDSVRKLSPTLQHFALDKHDWKMPGRKRLYRLDEINETTQQHTVFYKERVVTIDGEKQRMIVTFSLSRRNQERWVRQRQLTRVADILESAAADPDGEFSYRKKIDEEERFDGFSVLFTDFDQSAAAIIPVIQRRRETEENFRTIKREVKSPTLNVNGRERLYAHCMICFVSSIIERIIELKLKDRFTFEDVSEILRGMDMLDIPSEGYIPIYSRNDLTDALHEAFGFRTDNQITSGRSIRKLSADSKKPHPLDF